MVTLFENYTSRTLYPAQVEQLLINLYAYREILVRNAIQYCGLQNLLAFAVYPMLDYLGEYLDCNRLPAQYATTTLQFTLTAAQSSDTTIASGTQVGTTDGLYIFATTAALTDLRWADSRHRGGAMHYGRTQRQRLPRRTGQCPDGFVPARLCRREHNHDRQRNGG